MVFSSLTFIFYFLPIVFLFYFIVKSKYKNLVLLISSLFFYFYGEPRFIVILLFSCVINYFFGNIISKETDDKKRKVYLVIGLFIDFFALFYFKYFNFFIDNFNNLFNSDISYIKVIMPIGISFFTFQATSYIIDIYNRKVKKADSLLDFSTYLSLFPQLIAGPIVRYETVDDELKNRVSTEDDIYLGIKRFIIGLSKKVLVANVLGELVKILLGLEIKTVLSTWIYAISYSLQIYFDFSAYSDMAIGLGLMFGFHFLENFNYPFVSRSITEFWRRWHISLSTWLKDYIYIPLGGSRVSNLFWYRNILITWLFTGLWHGANWNYVIWGLYFGVLLVVEKKYLMKFLDKNKFISYLYTFILITVSFVIFNNENISTMFDSLKNLFFINNLALINFETIYYLKSYLVIIIISFFLATPILKNVSTKLESKFKSIYKYLETLLLIIIFIITISFIVDSSFNPFLYFRF